MFFLQNKKEVVKGKKAKQVVEAESSEEESEEEDEEEIPEPVKTKASKKQKNGKAKKAPEPDSDEEESEEEEEEEQPVKKNKKGKKEPEPEEEDDDDSEEEAPAKEDENASDDDSEEEEEEEKKPKKRKQEAADETPAKKTKSDETVSLFIGGLDFETTPDTIKDFFSENGIELSDVRKREGKRFGHVDLDDADDLDKAMKLHGSEIDGCEIRIDKADKNTSGGGDRRSQGGGPKGKTLTARNLSYDTTEESLKDCFEGAVSCRIPTFPDTGKSRGRGFIDFESEEAAESAMKVMNETEVDGRTIYVEFAHERGSGGGGRFGGGGGRGGRGGGGFRGGRDFGGRGGRGGGFRGGRGGRGGGGGYGGGRGGGGYGGGRMGGGGYGKKKTFNDDD
ncbi:hypothetical protein SNE40_005203 [Patella caerulea]|uniref:RRM domain-containing protein n=1 Tax=Patella caerulea TaxID=87958 RepID=A0AAN8QB25_PATCE